MVWAIKIIGIALDQQNLSSLILLVVHQSSGVIIEKEYGAGKKSRPDIFESGQEKPCLALR